MVARLNHPNIVTVHDAGEVDQMPFIVMELVAGTDLHEHTPAGIEDIIAIAKQLCSALEHAHNNEIIHRDLKPENIIITPEGAVKLMDFGLARSVASRLTVEGSTFDSPLVNLALYREFHRWWQLQDTAAVPNAFFIPGSNHGLFNADFDPNYGPYIAMAFGLSAGADKAGAGVDIDVVSRVNSILYLPGEEYHVDLGGPNYDGFPNTLSAEIEGKTRYFIDYSDFSYVREDVYPGYVCYDDVVTWQQNVRKSVMELAFGNEPASDSNIAGFALAADDARRVLVAIHDLGDAAVHWADPVFVDSGKDCPEVQ